MTILSENPPKNKWTKRLEWKNKIQKKKNKNKEKKKKTLIKKNL